MQQLKVYQSLWGMELRNPHARERTQEECFRMVADAGFDGMCIDPSVAEIPDFASTKILYRDHGLGCMINAFPYTEEDMTPLLDFADRMDACMVNVISGVMPIRPEDAVPIVQRWMQEADDHAMPLLFETHRDGLLNDMYYTLLLMELVPEMRLCADLSHFVVDREMRNTIVERDEKHISSSGRMSSSEASIPARSDSNSTIAWGAYHVSTTE